MEVGYWAGENEYDRYISVAPNKIPSKHARGLKSYINRLNKEKDNEQTAEDNQDTSE
jgi:hypothetical protein